MRDRVSDNRKWVAIVDDDASFREAISAHLGLLGIEPHPFSDGYSLLESGILLHFRCIFADFAMPGMTGVELHASLMRVGVVAPFVLMSARLSEREKVEAQAGGIFDVLDKPFSAQVMIDVLERLSIC